MTHKLKILPWYFEAVQKGIKNFEIRINDRGFKIGDKLLLQEWHDGKYTGREITRNIDYLLTDCEGLMDGFVIISWKSEKRPTGKWIISEIRCPYCLEYFDTNCYSKDELNKCPNCGAKIREA